MDDYQETLRRLAIPDTGFIERLLRDQDENVARSRIDARAFALVRIAALVTADATTASFAAACQDALQAEVTPEEIVGILIAVLPLIGAARVVAAAPSLGLALGYDVGAALEEYHVRAAPTDVA